MGLFIFISFSANAQEISSLKNQKPVRVNGNIGISTSMFFSNSTVLPLSPFSYFINGNLNLQLGGWNIPMSFAYYQQKISYSLPFKQFGISPSYKWIKLHAGYRNVTFSKYSLSNVTFLGGGIELTPGLLRFGAVYGVFNKAVTEDTTLLHYGNSNLNKPSFKREGYAVKLGYGKTSYFDVIIFRGRDLIGSIKEPLFSSITPEENLIVAFAAKRVITKNLFFSFDVAGSAYTYDRNSEVIPLGTSDYTKYLFKVFIPRVSTKFKSASDASINYSGKVFSCVLKYNRIEPFFKSMGTYYTTTDIETFGIVPTLSLFNNKVRLYASLEQSHDNLLKLKPVTNKIQNLNSSISMTINKNFGIDGNYGMNKNFPVKTYENVSDSLMFHQNTNQVSITPRLNFFSKRCINNTSLTVALQESEFSSISYNSKNTYQSAFINHTISSVKNGFQLTAGGNFSESKQSVFNSQTYGVSLSTGKPFFKKKVSVNLGGNFNYVLYNHVKTNTSLTLSQTISIKLGKMHTFSFSAFELLNKSLINTSSPDHQEAKVNAAYNFIF